MIIKGCVLYNLLKILNISNRLISHIQPLHRNLFKLLIIFIPDSKSYSIDKKNMHQESISHD